MSEALKSVSIRRDDVVRVLTGRDKNKEGRVLKVLQTKGRALVENVNKIKRHTKANPGKGVKGGVVEREASIHISNLKLVCPACGKPTRVAHQRDDGGRSVRVCKKCKAPVERKASS